MFEENEKVRAAIDKVYEVTETLNRGDVLTHEVIAQILGCEPHESPWDYVVYSVLNRLEKERGIAYWAIYEVGYKLLTVQEQLVDLPAHRTKKAKRQVFRSRRSMNRIRVKEMSAHQRRYRFMMTGLHQAVEKTLRDNLKEIHEPKPERMAHPRRRIDLHPEMRPENLKETPEPPPARLPHPRRPINPHPEQRPEQHPQS